MPTASIRVKYSKDLETLFKPEDSEFKNSKASFSSKKEGKDLVFQIKAKDIVSLRAMLNAITKTITVYEKVRKATEK